MPNLTVVERESVLVVDSRLVASSLVIADGNPLTTVDKYIERIKPGRFARLTEDRATSLMNLSRNTDEVVQCKLELVEAFPKAKRVIKEIISTQAQKITA